MADSAALLCNTCRFRHHMPQPVECRVDCYPNGCPAWEPAPEADPVHYGQQTRQLHGELLLALLRGPRESQIKALQQLAKSVHCDLTGELRGPHGLGAETLPPDEPAPMPEGWRISKTTERDGGWSLFLHRPGTGPLAGEWLMCACISDETSATAPAAYRAFAAHVERLLQGGH